MTTPTPQPITNEQRQVQELEEMLHNAYTARNEMFRQLMDPRRDLFHECGYPATLTPHQYQQLYDRNPYAARVVECMPKESWQTTPTVWEDEGEESTEFERAWDELGSSLSATKSWFRDEEGSAIWELLMRADIMAGIGQYGVILLGLNDGRDPSEPVEGVEERGSLPGATSPKNEKGERKLVSNAPVSETRKTFLDVEQPTVNWTDPYEDTLDPGKTPSGYVPYSLTTNKDRLRTSLTVNLVRSKPAPRDLEDDVADDAEPEVKAFVEPVKTKRKLIYARCFSQAQAMVTRWETNRLSPRFNQPVSYLITLDNPWEMTGGFVGQSGSTINVHWTRVVHVVDNRQNSDVLGQPRMQAVVNNLLNLDKIFGAAGEGFWKNSFTGLSIETHPQLGTNAKIDRASIKSQLENYENSLSRSMLFVGASAKTLAPTISDPTPHVDVNVGAIAVRLGMPRRVFEGSERGDVAAGTDDAAWNDELRLQQRIHNTPHVIVPFVDRCVLVGVLPEPKEYHVEWPDLESQTPAERSAFASAMTTALAAALQGGVVPGFFTEEDYLIQVCKFPEDVVKACLKRAVKQAEEELAEQEEKAAEQAAAMAEQGINPNNPMGGPPSGGPPGKPSPFGGKPSFGQPPGAGGGFPPKPKPPFTRNTDEPPPLTDNCGGPGSGVPGPCPSDVKESVTEMDKVVERIHEADEAHGVYLDAVKEALGEHSNLADPEDQLDALENVHDQLKDLATYSATMTPDDEDGITQEQLDSNRRNLAKMMAASKRALTSLRNHIKKGG
jgi:hypothetical protein